ncbi:DUF4752 family protein [Enterobacter roggenkampii]|uniref:DUF4752 family protein n=1 Tax=Enterobacter roggenkampii TaxID=1812935 RepID=UPI0020202038|nr:DUF4752 family protein [Enterobacter roggenkampii]MCL8153542.1 DUF4752 family protein [Enterobacter roggenkampii]MCM7560359.1 DUF4752 family protein [Enterobacter roggenkampii]HDS5417669.1 DUF4752 family protein [Citrobacter freundii]
MGAFKDFGATDWLFFVTLLIIWFYMVAKAYSWLIGVLIRRGWRLWNRKDEQTLAMDSFYEAFRLAEIEPGQRVVITTESGMSIHIVRPKGDCHA